MWSDYHLFSDKWWKTASSLRKWENTRQSNHNYLNSGRFLKVTRSFFSLTTCKTLAKGPEHWNLYKGCRKPSITVQCFKTSYSKLCAWGIHQASGILWLLSEKRKITDPHQKISWLNDRCLETPRSFQLSCIYSFRQ